MVIPSAVLSSFGYICYKARNGVYLIQEESIREKVCIYIELDDLFI